MLPETQGSRTHPAPAPAPAPRFCFRPGPVLQPQRATHLAEKVLPVDASCGVALKLHLGRGRLQWLCLWDAGDFVVGAFNPVAPELGQQNEGKGPFSPQDLKGDSAESYSHCTPPGAPGHLPN